MVAFSTKRKDLLIVGTSSTKTAPGKLIVSEDGGKHFQVVAEKNDWKVANVAFEAIPEGDHYIYFATSSGVYYCYNLGMYLYQYRHTVMPDVPYTAITSWTISKGRPQPDSDHARHRERGGVFRPHWILLVR